MILKIQRDKLTVSTMTLRSLRWGDLEIADVATLVPYRRQGHATQLLDRAKGIAVKRGMSLVAVLDPDRESGMTTEIETRWLIKHGFRKQRWYDFGGYSKPVMIFHPPKHEGLT